MSNCINPTTNSLRRLGRAAAASAAYLICSAWSAPAVAGMPDFTPDETTRRLVLTDEGTIRYEAISFFLLMLLLSAIAVRFLWNQLGKDFGSIPRLSLGKALGVVTAWGLLVLVVLTMIAVAREMMTPGSWRKQGLLYALDDAKAVKPVANVAAQLNAGRRKGLEDLKAALWEYAAEHNRKLPPADDPKVAGKLWEVPGSFGARYGYISGLSLSQDPRIVVFEPAVHGEQRFVLRLDGRIELLSSDAIRKELQQVTP
jgi:hypothetical protein